MAYNIGKCGDGKKPPVVTDIYSSNLVTGRSMKVNPQGPGSVPHSAHRSPVNQYGTSRIIAGRKGKK